MNVFGFGVYQDSLTWKTLTLKDHPFRMETAFGRGCVGRSNTTPDGSTSSKMTFRKEAQMTVDEQSRNRIVEKIIEDGRWVRTAFEDLRGGEVVRFFDPNVKKPLEQNGANVFMVVNEPQQVGSQGNIKVSVVPFKPDRPAGTAAECPYSGNIVVKAHGMDKLIEATGYCVQCPCMGGCLKARYSSEYFEQLRGALGLNDIDN